MKSFFLPVIGVIILVIAAWLLLHHSAVAPTGPSATAPAQTGAIAEAHYSCDNGKSIDAAFHEGTTTQAAQPGQPPVPTGTADVSLDGGATTTLHQTISADGVRYANAGESFVFWNKGNEALIMRDNSMDQTYTNCAAPSAQ